MIVPVSSSFAFSARILLRKCPATFSISSRVSSSRSRRRICSRSAVSSSFSLSALQGFHSREKRSPMEVSISCMSFDMSFAHFLLSAIRSVSCWLIVWDRMSSKSSRSFFCISSSVSSIAVFRIL